MSKAKLLEALSIKPKKASATCSICENGSTQYQPRPPRPAYLATLRPLGIPERPAEQARALAGLLRVGRTRIPIR
jgi:hypothetical protein